MAVDDFSKSAASPDFQVILFYNPKTQFASAARNSMDKNSIVLAGYAGKIPFTNSFQVDPSAKKIDKEAHILPVTELAGLVKAVKSYDPRGYTHQLELRETNLLGREYYVSLGKQGDKGVILTPENIDTVIDLIKAKESIEGLVRAERTNLASSMPSGVEGPQ